MADTSKSETGKDRWGHEITGTVTKRDINGNPTEIVNENGTYVKDPNSWEGRLIRKD